MIITVPDPHPGRCLNYRMGRRCIDYDKHDSPCTFEKRKGPAFGEASEYAGWSLVPKEPVPWVRPEEEK